MEITTELKQTLKKLKLGGILPTLPERGSYAKAQKLSYGDFLELVLNDEIERRRPGTKVLYTSGYTENAIIHHGRLDAGVLLLVKPYRKSDLADMIRKALGD